MQYGWNYYCTSTIELLFSTALGSLYFLINSFWDSLATTVLYLRIIRIRLMACIVPYWILQKLSTRWQKKFGEEVDQDLLYLVSVERVLHMEDFNEVENMLIIWYYQLLSSFSISICVWSFKTSHTSFFNSLNKGCEISISFFAPLLAFPPTFLDITT